MRTTILLAAVLWAGVVQAREAFDPVLSGVEGPSDAPIAQAKTTPAADDEEEDPNPGAKKPPPDTSKKPEEKKETPAMGAVAPTPAGNADTQKLVSGAPLYNPNVAVHIVEQKAYSDAGRHEIILFPFTQIQVNGKFAQHYGLGGGYVFHLQENFGFQVSGFYNYFSSESAFNAELVDKVQEEAQAATSLLNVWGALAGVEVTPFYGKFAWYESSLAHFSLVLNAGAGIGGTRHQLKPSNTAGPATFGDTGLRFLGGLGGGLRLQLGKHFAIRVEVRDVVYTAKVDTVNGCNKTDLAALLDKSTSGKPLSSAIVTSGCNISGFSGAENVTSLPLALALIQPPGKPQPPPSSDVLNNLSLYLGVSFLF